MRESWSDNNHVVYFTTLLMYHVLPLFVVVYNCHIQGIGSKMLTNAIEMVKAKQYFQKVQ